MNVIVHINGGGGGGLHVKGLVSLSSHGLVGPGVLTCCLHHQKILNIYTCKLNYKCLA